MDIPRTNTFNDEGRIPQIEYAIKNVSQAGTIIGYKCKNGIIFIGLTNKPENNQIKNKIDKIYKITNNIFCCISGLFADSLQIISIARMYANNHFFEYNEEIKLKCLLNNISDNLQYFTHVDGLRPFGISMLFSDLKNNLLMSIDPAGSVNEWKAKAFGKEEDHINNEIKFEEKEMKDAAIECFKILGMKQEISESKSYSYEVAFLNEKVYFLNEEEIKEIVRLSKAE